MVLQKGFFFSVCHYLSDLTLHFNQEKLLVVVSVKAITRGGPDVDFSIFADVDVYLVFVDADAMQMFKIMRISGPTLLEVDRMLISRYSQMQI